MGEFKFIMVFLIIVVFYFIINRKNTPLMKDDKKQPIMLNLREPFVNTDRIFSSYPSGFNELSKPQEPPKEIMFNYTERPIDKEFQKEQNESVDMSTWYGNNYITKVVNGKPIWSSRSDETGQPNEPLNGEARLSYEFNKEKSFNMDGVIAPEASGTKIKDVFDNYFVNYKKMTPKKEKKKVRFEDMNEADGASSLSFFTPDTWTYENEKPENGGMITNGLYAADMNNMDPVAIF